ncbi:uncharacterized protein EV154DRAFT_585127 [Mucor mucedo]|uniref:uncharacterized protein n=1 Tax=Mucor mucedo TaxID=29922 RepID=UPI002220A931|nr:uncharacterized protein EV154DRAFT_585127 [Mucor mucedo]KAI7896902.1 hypothetical protein EV154DRAFT_585127 [Mucor mucedo]
MVKFILLLSALITAVVAKLTYPTDGTVWKVGEPVSVTFAPGQPAETVNMYFSHDRSIVIGSGPISEGGSFEFIVPPNAVNPAGGPAELVVIHRVDLHLYSVDTIAIQIEG